MSDEQGPGTIAQLIAQHERDITILHAKLAVMQALLSASISVLMCRDPESRTAFFKAFASQDAMVRGIAAALGDMASTEAIAASNEIMEQMTADLYDFAPMDGPQH